MSSRSCLPGARARTYPTCCRTCRSDTAASCDPGRPVTRTALAPTATAKPWTPRTAAPTIRLSPSRFASWSAFLNVERCDGQQQRPTTPALSCDNLGAEAVPSWARSAPDQPVHGALSVRRRGAKPREDYSRVSGNRPSSPNSQRAGLHRLDGRLRRPAGRRGDLEGGGSRAGVPPARSVPPPPVRADLAGRNCIRGPPPGPGAHAAPSCVGGEGGGGCGVPRRLRPLGAGALKPGPPERRIRRA
jgi:hypothetical protein